MFDGGTKKDSLPGVTEESLRPYSERQSGVLGLYMRAIRPPAECTFITTPAFTGQDGSLTWQIAWLEDASTHSWRVNRHVLMPRLSNDRQIVTIHVAVSFYDAVYSCAWFQETQEDLGNTISTERKPVKAYREIAESVGIPFDKDGMPGLAVDGDIRTPGLYDEKAFEVAKLTKLGSKPDSDDAALKAMRAIRLDREVKEGPLEYSRELARQQFEQARKTEKEQTQQKKKQAEAVETTVKRLRAINDAVDRVVKAVEETVAQGFASSIIPAFPGGYDDEGLVMEKTGGLAELRRDISTTWKKGDKGTAIIGGGLGCATLLGKGAVVWTARALASPFQYVAGTNPQVSADRFFNVRIKEFQALLDQAPLSALERPLYETFMKAAQQAYNFEHGCHLARQAYAMDPAAQKVGAFEKKLQEAEACIREVGKAALWPEPDVINLIKSIYNNKMPDRGVFLSSLKNTRNEVRLQTAQMIKMYEQQIAEQGTKSGMHVTHATHSSKVYNIG